MAESSYISTSLNERRLRGVVVLAAGPVQNAQGEWHLLIQISSVAVIEGENAEPRVDQFVIPAGSTLDTCLDAFRLAVTETQRRRSLPPEASVAHD